MTHVSAPSSSGPDVLRRKRNVVGLVAIALLLLLTVLSLTGVISVTVWIVADIFVALAANLILILMGRQRKQ
jgi:hypothetical protein